MQGRLVAVTGATGFVGAHLARGLLAAGARVRGVVRSPERGAALAAVGVELVRGDLLDPASLVEAFRGCEVVVGNAAATSGAGSLEAMTRVNLDGARHTLDAAQAAGVRRVVWISTVAVYQTRLFTPMREDARRYDASRRRFNWSDLTTDWRYARTKTQAEDLVWARCEALGLAVTVLRPGPVYGSGDPKLTGRYLGALDRALVFAPTVGVPHVHAGDVALAVVGALRNERSVGRAYNLAGPPTSPWQAVRALRRLAGRGRWLLPLPVPLSVCYDTTAAAQDLGFAPRSLEDGLREAWQVDGRAA